MEFNYFSLTQLSFVFLITQSNECELLCEKTTYLFLVQTFCIRIHGLDNFEFSYILSGFVGLF